MENIPLYIKNKTSEINCSDYTFESLFRIMHNQGDRIFAEYDDVFSTISVSYCEIKNYCLKAASFLREQTSENSSEFVGIYLENSINWVATFWGLLMIGKKPMLLNVKLPDSVNENIISLLNIKFVISADNKVFSGAKVICIENKLGICREYQNSEAINTFNWENEIALATTATSLNYKVCIYTGRDITNQVLDAKGILNQNKMVKRHYKGRLKQLAFLPFYHIFGLIAAYFWFATYGRTFVFLKDYAPRTILDTIKCHNVTHIFAVPLLWNTIVREIKKEINALPKAEAKRAEKAIDISLSIQKLFPGIGMHFSRILLKQIVSKTLGNSICFLISGGGYIASETLKTINAIGYPLHNGYGSTETGITSVELRENVKYRLCGSVGRPFDSVEYMLEDDIIYVRGLSTCSKIIEKDGKTTEINHKDWFKTNDIGAVDKTGSYYIKGRKDDVITAENGEKINPDFLEQGLLLTSVSEYCILGLNGVASLVVKVPNAVNVLQAKRICSDVEGALKKLSESGFMGINCYYTYDALAPKNAIKVSRKLLLSKINDGSVKLMPFSEIAKIKEKDADEIKSDIAAKISEIIAEILDKNVSEIGLDDHLIFDLGGTSLDYCSLLIELENEFGSGSISQGAITVRELAKAVLENYERC